MERESLGPIAPHKQTLECGKQVTAEFWEPRLGKYLQVSVSPICNEKNGTIATVHIARDIPEPKRAEEALREREERYRTLLETMEEGYFEVDLKGNFTLVNDSMCKMFNASSKDDLMGLNNREYMPKGDLCRAA